MAGAGVPALLLAADVRRTEYGYCYHRRAGRRLWPRAHRGAARGRRDAGDRGGGHQRAGHQRHAPGGCIRRSHGRKRRDRERRAGAYSGGSHRPCDGKQHAGRMQPGHGPRRGGKPGSQGAHPRCQMRGAHCGPSGKAAGPLHSGCRRGRANSPATEKHPHPRMGVLLRFTRQNCRNSPG